MIKYNNSIIVRFSSAMVSGFVSHFHLVRLGIDVEFLLCPQMPLEFLQQLKLPSNATEGDHPRTTLQLQLIFQHVPLSTPWKIEVDNGTCWNTCQPDAEEIGTKWESCRQPVNLQ